MLNHVWDSLKNFNVSVFRHPSNPSSNNSLHNNKNAYEIEENKYNYILKDLRQIGQELFFSIHFARQSGWKTEQQQGVVNSSVSKSIKQIGQPGSFSSFISSLSSFVP